jgi:hypothetical protein
LLAVPSSELDYSVSSLRAREMVQCRADRLGGGLLIQIVNPEGLPLRE